MPDVNITYKGNTIATMDASGSKDLLTRGKYCEDDISITYAKPSGGSSPIQLLGAVTVPSDTRAINIDTTPYNNYDFYLCIVDATLSEADWLYVVKDGSSPSGGTYQRSSINHQGRIFEVAKQSSYADKFTYIEVSNGSLNFTSGAPNNMYFYTYKETTLIKAGSTFKIYGGNYADM